MMLLWIVLNQVSTFVSLTKIVKYKKHIINNKTQGLNILYILLALLLDNGIRDKQIYISRKSTRKTSYKGMLQKKLLKLDFKKQNFEPMVYNSLAAFQ